MGSVYSAALNLTPDATAADIERVADAKGLKFFANETATPPFYVISHRCVQGSLARGDLATIRQFVQNYGT